MSAGQDRSCCGVVEESAARARDRRENKPQPWLVLKFMVAITLGIMGYAAYVYLAIFIKPMIQERQDAVSNRRAGIALLVPFCVLYLWMLWAYFKVVFTSPGKAKDYAKRCRKPLLPPGISRGSLHPTDEDDNDRIGRASYEEILRATTGQHEAKAPPPPMARTASSATITSGSSHGRLRFNAGEMVNPAVKESDETNTNNPPISPPPRVPSPARTSEHTAIDPEPQAGVLDAPAFNPDPDRHRRRRQAGKSYEGCSSFSTTWLCCQPPEPDLERGETNKSGKIRKTRREPPRPRTFVTRRPPSIPLLHPANLYCDREGFVKPYRAHHCRLCGTCILKFDHHCPWIGQCVGARNQKFFVNFCIAAFFLTSYVFATVLPYTVTGLDQRWVNTSPQQIVLIALAGVFALFTSSLAVSHIYMVLHGQTTVESMSIRAMKKREVEQLAKAYSWWQVDAKRQLLRQWDKEWGKLDTEANMWWMGSRWREWKAVMGRNWLGWLLPIGRSESDGLSYPVNPRFGPEGKWRKREEWPVNLR